MSMFAVKRISNDIKNYMNSNLKECGIYCDFNEENIYNVKVLIIGPENTPYENGFHLFDFNFPKNYPVSPPSVLFVSTDRRIRAHPNLYINGKVCLSFLGTWSGPGWTAALTLNTILLSIQSLLNEEPLHNEPGYQNEKGSRCEIYRNLVNYYNIVVSTLKQINTPLRGYEAFQKIMKSHFVKNYDNYLKQLEKFKDISQINQCVYGMGAKIEYSKVKQELVDTYNKITSDPEFMSLLDQPELPLPEPIPNTVIEASQPKPKTNSRKAPNIKAKDHDIGFETISENDNKTYVVIETKNGYKRWVKKKE